MYYVQEDDKPNFIFRLFNIIKLQNNVIILPLSNESLENKDRNRNKRREERLAKKLVRVLNKTNSKKLILSKKIKEQEMIVNYLYTHGYDISDDTWLFEILSERVLDYIVDKKELNKQEIQLSILVNDVGEFEIEIIKKLLNKYKKVNIVTNHLEKFKNIENKILEDDGIAIAITNNKRKSLAKSDLILNIDFPTELLNKYNIYEDAIIINIKSKTKINKKRFNGLNINDYEIDFESSDEMFIQKNEKFSNKDIYEAQIYQKQPFKNIMNKINADKIIIEELIASNIKI